MLKKKRPDILKGSTYCIITGCGKLYVTINTDDAGIIFEIFTQMGKAGGCAACQSEASARLASLAFRLGAIPSDVIKQLKGITCHTPAITNGVSTLSCADAIAQAISRYVTDSSIKSVAESFKCPDCGNMLQKGEICPDCGTQNER